MTAPPVIEARDVYKTFSIKQGLFKPKKPLHAVNGVSFGLEKGSVLGLVGESGCGKTTMARMILGLETMTNGEILIDGEPLSGLDRIALARRVQPIFQDPYSSLNPRKSIGSIISLPLRVHKVGDPNGWKKRVEKMMELVGLPPRLYHNYPSQLSGGQRQRVAIGRALIMKPEILICDEPTSALDVSVQAQILNELLDLQKELDLTYILITHNLAVVEHMATRVAVMYLGRVVEEAETATLFKNPRHPYTKALLGSILTPEPELDVPDTHLGATFPNPVEPPSGCTFHPRCAEVMAKCSTETPRPCMVGDVKVECHLFDREMQEAS
ncbi:MAG: ATP-binding cassette domain-containing protein [Alphaproteobacteria bacterium]|jgi:peptide/nickel transport system ATP-binding protein|nr:ATP-binding cassette domain-containing protein [Alphaproteobacteria bacterium]